MDKFGVCAAQFPYPALLFHYLEIFEIFGILFWPAGHLSHLLTGQAFNKGVRAEITFSSSFSHCVRVHLCPNRVELYTGRVFVLHL